MGFDNVKYKLLMLTMDLKTKGYNPKLGGEDSQIHTQNLYWNKSEESLKDSYL